MGFLSTNGVTPPAILVIHDRSLRGGNEWRLVPWSELIMAEDWMTITTTGKGPENFKAAYRHVVDRVRARRGSCEMSFTRTAIPTLSTEFCAGLLSRGGICRLARHERLWPAVQRRTLGKHAITGRLAVSGNVRARSEQTDHDRRVGDRRIPPLGQQRRVD